MILVTGGTGNVGKSVVEGLQAKGHPVRVLTRRPNFASTAGVEVVRGDLTNEQAVRQALHGVDRVFLVQVSHGEGFPALAKALGVERLVFLSSGAIDAPTENAIGRLHRHSESLIQDTGISWTFLRPGAFMTNALQWASSIRLQGVVRAPFTDVAVPAIDPRDVGRVAAETLATPGHEGKIYPLIGPEALSIADQVAILGEVLGRSIRLEPVSDAVAAEEMARWAPKEIVDAVFSLMREQKHQFAGTADVVGRITGAPPHTFREWARDHASFFR